MNDQKLRTRLAAAAGTILDQELLTSIHDRLVAIDGNGKIPVTLKFVFSIETGELAVDIQASAAMLLQSFNMRLTSDGKQMQLFEPKPKTEEVEASTTTAETKTKAPAKKAAAKKAAAKKAAATKPAPVVEEPAEPAEVVKPPALKASERLAEIASQNEALYRNGLITEDQAAAAGVDVAKVDAESDMTTGEASEDDTPQFDQLTAEDLIALQSA